MKIIGQPANYSEILQRVFWCTLASGVVCTYVFAEASPSAQTFLDSISAETDLGPIKNIKVLYLLVPLFVALISRLIKLHDRISDLLGLRKSFDIREILLPLAHGTGALTEPGDEKKIRDSRVKLMYSVFYRYAGFKQPFIDDQLVRTAADHWGWFWVLIESAFIFLLTGIILTCIQAWCCMLFCIAIFIAEVGGAYFLMLACKRSARAEVEAILADQQRADSIREEFAKP